MSNRWVNALVKTIVLLVIVHVIVWIVSLFGVGMLWAHWTSIWGAIITIVCTIIAYFVIYAYFTGGSTDN